MVTRISRQPPPVEVMVDQKQLNCVKCFNYLVTTTTKYAICKSRREIKSRTVTTKAAFNREKTLFASKFDINLRSKLVKCYIWSTSFYGAETWTLQKVDHTYLESFKMRYWRRTEKISWNDRVKKKKSIA